MESLRVGVAFGGGALTEAEEERVHTHAKNTEEATGDDIGPHDGGLQETKPIGIPGLWGLG